MGAAMKTHWLLKSAFFVASVISLSWFFAGWRGINEHGQMVDWALLVGATLLTMLLLVVQGFWIYVEELTKGSLKRRIPIFDKVHAKLNANADKKGEL